MLWWMQKLSYRFAPGTPIQHSAIHHSHGLYDSSLQGWIHCSTRHRERTANEELMSFQPSPVYIWPFSSAMSTSLAP